MRVGVDSSITGSLNESFPIFCVLGGVLFLLVEDGTRVGLLRLGFASSGLSLVGSLLISGLLRLFLIIHSLLLAEVELSRAKKVATD